MKYPVFFLSVTLLCQSAHAELVPSRQEQLKDKWHFSFSPYLWGASVNGRNGPILAQGHSPVDSKMSFSDIFKDSNFSFMAMGEARRDRFSIFSDLSYVNFSQDQEISNNSDLDIKAKSLSFAMGAGYAIINESDKVLDVVIAGKLWHTSMRYHLTSEKYHIHETRKGDATWVDVLSGFKGKYSLSPSVFLEGWGLVGGGQAKKDWDVAGLIGYNFYGDWMVTAGYRAIGVDYDRDNYIFDVTQKGPIIGIYAKF